MIRSLRNKLKLKQTYRSVFNTPEGRKVLHHLLRESGISRPDLSTDPNENLVKAGRQQIVYSILRMVGEGDDFILSQIEQLEQERMTQNEDD